MRGTCNDGSAAASPAVILVPYTELGRRSNSAGHQLPPTTLHLYMGGSLPDIRTLPPSCGRLLWTPLPDGSPHADDRHPADTFTSTSSAAGLSRISARVETFYLGCCDYFEHGPFDSCVLSAGGSKLWIFSFFCDTSKSPYTVPHCFMLLVKYMCVCVFNRVSEYFVYAGSCDVLPVRWAVMHRHL